MLSFLSSSMCVWSLILFAALVAELPHSTIVPLCHARAMLYPCTRCQELNLGRSFQAEHACKMEQEDVKYLPGAVLAEGRHIRQWDVLWAVHDKVFEYFQLLKQQDDKVKQLDSEREHDLLEARPASLGF
jgi:hypothetical protein